jgi:hypothetical protein
MRTLSNKEKHVAERYDAEYDFDLAGEEITSIRKELQRYIDSPPDQRGDYADLNKGNYVNIGITLEHALTFCECVAMSVLSLLNDQLLSCTIQLTGREVVALRFCAKRGWCSHSTLQDVLRRSAF